MAAKEGVDAEVVVGDEGAVVLGWGAEVEAEREVDRAGTRAGENDDRGGSSTGRVDGGAGFVLIAELVACCAGAE